MSNSIMSIGLQGVMSGMARIGEVASRVADPANADSPAVEDLVQLKTEQQSVSASAKVIKVGADLQQSVLDILA